MDNLQDSANGRRGLGNRLLVFGAIIGLCLIIAASIGSFTFYFIRTKGDTLWVTGSVKQKVVSDLAKWTGGFSRSIPMEDLTAGYAQMKQDENLTIEFFKSFGFTEKDVLISPVFMESPFQYDPNAPKEYILRQNVEIQSNDIAKITEMTKNAQILIEKGVIFSTFSLEYYYTKLPELRIALLKDAATDAKMRAQKIAESTGLSVGSIKSADAGIVQVLQVNSNAVSDWGTYDTSTIEKEVMVTVTAQFNLK